MVHPARQRVHATGHGTGRPAVSIEPLLLTAATPERPDVSEQPATEKAPPWPPVIDGLAYAEEPPRFTAAQAAAALARAEAEAPPPTLANKGGILLPVEAMWLELPREPSLDWEFSVGISNGQPTIGLRVGNEAAEIVVPGANATGDPHALLRLLIFRILADKDAMQ